LEERGRGKNRCGDQRKKMASAEDKGAPGRRKTEEKKEWNSPRTYVHFRKLQGPICKTKFPIDLKP
jgi:hypothetical protein